MIQKGSDRGQFVARVRAAIAFQEQFTEAQAPLGTPRSST
jgi:hypothetical protein